MDTRSYKPYLLLTFSVIFWSISYIWTKQVFTLYTPITTIFLRVLLSSVFLLTFGKITRLLQKPKREDRMKFLAISLLQPFLYFLGENQGLYYLTPTVVAIIIATIPLFVAFVEHFLLKNRLKPVNFYGIFISIFGVLLVLARGNSFHISVNIIGLLFLSLAVFAAVGYTVSVGGMTKRYNTFTLITYQNLIGIIYFAPVFGIFEFSRFIRTTPTIEVLKPLIYLAIFSSSLAFIFFVYGIKKIGVTKASTFANIIPAFTAAFSFLLLGENLSNLNILGIGIVIFGVFIAQYKKNGIKKS